LLPPNTHKYNFFLLKKVRDHFLAQEKIKCFCFFLRKKEKKQRRITIMTVFFNSFFLKYQTSEISIPDFNPFFKPGRNPGNRFNRNKNKKIKKSLKNGCI